MGLPPGSGFLILVSFKGSAQGWETPFLLPEPYFIPCELQGSGKGAGGSSELATRAETPSQTSPRSTPATVAIPGILWGCLGASIGSQLCCPIFMPGACLQPHLPPLSAPPALWVKIC